MPAGRLEDFIGEHRILEDLEHPDTRLIMIVGSADTGKTTFVQHLINHLSRNTHVGVVDLDMGQSHIGLPTTVAWGKVEGSFSSWSAISVEDFYFTGTLSPVGNLVPSLVGARLITENARNSCPKVIIDTTGLIAEPAGRVLKQYKIDLLSPDVVLAIEKSGELRQILDCFRLHRSPRIYRLPVPGRVQMKSPEMRTQYRTRQFRPYFEDAQVLEVSLKETTLRFTREPVQLKPEDLKNRLVSLRDESNRDVAVGIVEKILPGDGKLLIRAPVDDNRKFPTLVVGMIKVSL